MIENKEFNFKKIKTKITIWDYDLGYQFNFYFKRKRAGWIILEKEKKRSRRFDIHFLVLDRGIRNRGLGLYMISLVIDWCTERDLKVRSFPIKWHSEEELRIWNSEKLRDKYYIQERAGYYLIKPYSTDLLQNVRTVKLKKNMLVLRKKS